MLQYGLRALVHTCMYLIIILSYIAAHKQFLTCWSGVQCWHPNNCTNDLCFVLLSFSTNYFKLVHDPLSLTWIKFNPSMNKYTHPMHKAWEEITCPLPNFNVEVWEWISNFIPLQLLCMWLIDTCMCYPWIATHTIAWGQAWMTKQGQAWNIHYPLWYIPWGSLHNELTRIYL